MVGLFGLSLLLFVADGQISGDFFGHIDVERRDWRN